MSTSPLVIKREPPARLSISLVGEAPTAIKAAISAETQKTDRQVLLCNMCRNQPSII